MGFDWNQFLALAEFLKNHVEPTFSRDAAFRAGASRAYYAAFNLARQYAEKYLGFLGTGLADDHTRLRQHFEFHGKRDIAADLDILRQWRNLADYEDEVQNLLRVISEAIRKARKVAQKLASVI